MTTQTEIVATVPARIDWYVTVFLQARAPLLAKKTWADYKHVLTRFSGQFEAWPPSEASIIAYIGMLQREGLAARTVEKHYQKLTTWLAWLTDKCHLASNPAARLRYRPDRPPAVALAAAPAAGPDRPESAFNEYLRTYLAAKRQEGLSPTTVGVHCTLALAKQKTDDLGRYGYHLLKLGQWLDARGITEPAKIDRTLLRAYFDANGRWGPNTRRQSLRAMKSFFKFLLIEGIISTDPARELKAPAIKPKIRRTLTPDQVYQLFIACSGSGPDDIRNLALLSLALDTGLRASELCRLRLAGLHFDTPPPGYNEPLNWLQVRIKGGREELAYFSAPTAYRLLRWLDLRPQLARTPRDNVFLGIGGLTPGKPLTPDGLRAIMRALSRRAGLPRFSPHDLRRSMATIALQAGASTRLVQGMGRWQNLSEVTTYTRSLEIAPLVGRFSPVSFVNAHREQSAPAAPAAAKPAPKVEPEVYTFTVTLEEVWR